MVKKFEYPQTPYDRLLGSQHLTDEQKLKLQQSKENLSLFELAVGLERKLAYFYEQVRKIKLTKDTA